METTATAQAITAAVATRTALVAIALAAKPRQAKAAWAAVEDADQMVNVATREHEQAVRAAMPGATQAEVMAVAMAA